MTTTPSRPATAWPGLHTVPTGFKADVSARIARQLFRAAVRRLPVSVHDGSTVHGLGGPEHGAAPTRRSSTPASAATG